MIQIKNSQRKIVFDVDMYKNTAQKLLDILGYSDFDLGILLTTNKTVARYNKDYRNQDKPTDILSFPYHHTLKAGETINPTCDDDKNLGDIIISLEYVQKDALRWNCSLQERMIVLLVHGICHLLGYDHISDTDYELMHTQEQLLLQKILV